MQVPGCHPENMLQQARMGSRSLHRCKTPCGRCDTPGHVLRNPFWCCTLAEQGVPHKTGASFPDARWLGWVLSPQTKLTPWGQVHSLFWESPPPSAGFGEEEPGVLPSMDARPVQHLPGSLGLLLRRATRGRCQSSPPWRRAGGGQAGEQPPKSSFPLCVLFSTTPLSRALHSSGWHPPPTPAQRPGCTLILAQ